MSTPAVRLANVATRRTRVALLGCGWGAYQFLKEIDHNKYKCFVVSPRNHMLFTPLLASSAVGTTNLRSICQPVRPLVQKKRGRYYEAKAIGIDKENQTITCETFGTTEKEHFDLKYDKLVIGVGFQANDFGIPEVGKYAMFMKETADAARLHEHILQRFEQASLLHIMDGDENLSPQEEEQIRRLLSFVIVGAGPTGVELSGELTDLLKKDIFKQYYFLKKFISVHLVDAAPTVLGPFQDSYLQQYAQRHLEKKQSVNIKLSEFVDTISESKITFKSGAAIEYGTLVWCAGIKPYPFIRGMDVAKNKQGSQLLTDAHLQVIGEEKIHAIGDCATIENNWLPQTAQVATQQAKYLAKEFNKADDKMHVRKPFQFNNMGMMANLGGLGAVIKAPVINRLTGFLAWVSWRSAYWSMQLSIRNRFMLATDWLGTSVFGRDLMRKGSISKMQ